MGNVSNYNQLMDIAKSAYGSGVFEGSKGGNGYVGQYVDADGVAHTVKVLTHSAERKEYANDNYRMDYKNLADATKQLKANLIAIAGGEGTKLGEKIKAMLDAAQAKAAAEKMTASKKVGGEEVGLLSRKIVAQAVSTIAKEANVTNENGHAFSWSDVARNRAATVEDTTVHTVEVELLEKNHDRLYVEWDALERKFGNWRASIPNPDQKELHRKFYILLGLSADMNRISGVMDEHKDMPFCKAAKSNCRYFNLSAALREKLNTLNDNLTARQMLEELHDMLDVDGDEDGLINIDGGYTVAFRLFLEKRAAEEEQQANAGVQNQNQPVQNQNPPEQPKINNNKHAEAVKNERNTKKLQENYENFSKIERDFKEWQSRIPTPDEEEVEWLHDERRTVHPFDLISKRYDDLKNKIEANNGDVIATIKKFCDENDGNEFLRNLGIAIGTKVAMANMNDINDPANPKEKLSLTNLMMDDENESNSILDNLDVPVKRGADKNYDIYVDVLAVRLILEEARKAEMKQVANEQILKVVIPENFVIPEEFMNKA